VKLDKFLLKWICHISKQVFKEVRGTWYKRLRETRRVTGEELMWMSRIQILEGLRVRCT